MRIQKLTAKSVKAAARKAYKARRLTAQHRNPEKRECVYVSGAYHCAIGAALNKQSRRMVKDNFLNEGTSIDVLVSSDVIVIDDDEFDELGRIQTFHDQWADGSRSFGANSDIAKESRNAFLECIGIRKSADHADS